MSYFIIYADFSVTVYFKRNMTIKFIKITVMVLLIFIQADYSNSQTEDSLKSAWSGAFSLNGLYQSGNTNKIYVSGKGEIKNSGKVIETILSTYLGYGESNNKKDNNDFYSSLTADLFYTNEWSPFLLEFIEFNYASGIDFRNQTGAGIKYSFIKSEKHKSSVSAAFIYDYTNLTSKPGNSKKETPRLSLRLKTKQFFFNGKMNFSFVSFYQPSLKELSNAIFRLESILEIPLSKQFSVNATYKYIKDDVVSVGRKRVDAKLTFGAGFNF